MFSLVVYVCDTCGDSLRVKRMKKDQGFYFELVTVSKVYCEECMRSDGYWFVQKL